MPQIESGMQADIAAFLPNAMKVTIQSYIRFAEEEATAPDEGKCAKTFKDHHDACKVAIAHIKLLIELAKWADIPPPEMEDEIQQSVLRSVLESANKELHR